MSGLPVAVAFRLWMDYGPYAGLIAAWGVLWYLVWVCERQDTRKLRRGRPAPPVCRYGVPGCQLIHDKRREPERPYDPWPDGYPYERPRSYLIPPSAQTGRAIRRMQGAAGG